MRILENIQNHPKSKINSYLQLLRMKNEGEKGNDFIRLYNIRTYLRGIICKKYSRMALSKLLKVNVKSMNNWIGDFKDDTGIPIKYALKIVELAGRSENDLFNHVSYLGCTNSKKYMLPKSISPELSYLLGSLIGDGHLANPGDLIHNGSEYNAEIRITDGDRKQLLFLRRIFKNLFDYKPPLFREGTFYRLVGRSKVIHSFLYRVCGIPVGEKKNKTCIPKIIKGCHKYENWFLSGLFDSDGSISGGIIRIKQHNRALLVDCKRILEKSGISVSGIYIDKGMRKGTPTINHVLVVGRKDEINKFITIYYSNKIKNDKIERC